MKVIKHVFVAGVLIPVGVLLLMVLADIVRPYKPIEVVIEPHYFVYPETQDNWSETAHSIGVHPDSLTIEQFIEHDKCNGYSYQAAQEQLTEYLANK